MSVNEKKQRIEKLAAIQESYSCSFKDKGKEHIFFSALVRDYTSLPSRISDVSTQLQITLANKYVATDYLERYLVSNAIVDDHFHEARPAKLVCVKDTGNNTRELHILTYSQKDIGYASIDVIKLKEINGRFFIVPSALPKALAHSHKQVYFDNNSQIIPSAYISIRHNIFKQDMSFDPNCIACK